MGVTPYQVEHRVHLKLAKYIRNRANANMAVTDPNLRDLISFCIANADDLKNYSHLGVGKYTSVECDAFMKLVNAVTSPVCGIPA